MNTVRAITTMLAIGFAAPVLASELTPAPEGASVYIISPSDGDTLTNPVTILFGLTGMGVAPAGADLPNTGHHHLLINVDPAEVEMEFSLPADDNYRHFGGGQTQVTLDLPQGSNTLFMLLGDQNHVPHDPPIMSEVITVTVE